MKKHYRKGQSILEYTLLLGAIIAVIVAVLLGSGGTNTGIKGQIQNTYSRFGNAVQNTTNDLSVGVFK